MADMNHSPGKRKIPGQTELFIIHILTSFARFWTKNGTYNNLGGIINVN
jgi:hypothetical protein